MLKKEARGVVGGAGVVPLKEYDSAMGRLSRRSESPFAMSPSTERGVSVEQLQIIIEIGQPSDNPGNKRGGKKVITFDYY